MEEWQIQVRQSWVKWGNGLKTLHSIALEPVLGLWWVSTQACNWTQQRNYDVSPSDCWCGHRSWGRDRAWCSSWTWGAPPLAGAEPARRSPGTGTGRQAPHTLKRKKETAEHINSEIADAVGPDLRTGNTVPPCSEAMKCDTSSVLHSVGLAGRQLWAEVSVATKGGGWWHEAEEAGERDMRSSSSSPSSPLVSPEWLGSEWHCGERLGLNVQPGKLHNLSRISLGCWLF